MPPDALLHCARNVTVAGMRRRCAMAHAGGVTRLRARSIVAFVEGIYASIVQVSDERAHDG